MVGIIYCFSQKDTETLCNDLCGQGVSASCYHANMVPYDRSKVHKLWLNNTIQVSGVAMVIYFYQALKKLNNFYISSSYIHVHIQLITVEFT